MSTAPTDRGMGSVWAASTWVIRATNPHCRGQGAVSWCCGQDQRSKGGPAPASVQLSWAGKAGPTQDRLCPNGREVLGCGTRWLPAPGQAGWLPADSHGSCPARWVSRARKVLAWRQFPCAGAREHAGGRDTRRDHPVMVLGQLRGAWEAAEWLSR